MQQNDQLISVPNDICISYFTSKQKFSSKCIQKAVNYYSNGYIHDIRTKSTSKDELEVVAKCWRSMRKNDPPHSLSVTISTTLKQLTEAYCSCKAGLGGYCSHTLGLVKSLQFFKLNGYTRVPDQLSCTSLPQTWQVPRGNKIKPVPLQTVTVARPQESRKRKPITCSLQTVRVPAIKEENLEILQETTGSPLTYIVQKTTPLVETHLGRVQLGSVLSYQREIEELRAVLVQQKAQVTQLEIELGETRSRAELDATKMKEEQNKLRDRYDRLLDGHRKMQKVNHTLEDKFLTVIEKYEIEKRELTESVGVVTLKLSEAATRLQDLEEDCERYRSDCAVAVQLLQCRPSDFMAHKLNTLPLDLQERIHNQLTGEDNLQDFTTNTTTGSSSGFTVPTPSNVRIPMPTFPPIAVFSTTSDGTNSTSRSVNDGQFVPMSLLAEVLGDSAKFTRNSPAITSYSYVCSSCQQGSGSGMVFVDRGCQTVSELTRVTSFPDVSERNAIRVASLGVNCRTFVEGGGGGARDELTASVHRPARSSDTMSIRNN